MFPSRFQPWLFPTPDRNLHELVKGNDKLSLGMMQIYLKANVVDIEERRTVYLEGRDPTGDLHEKMDLINGIDYFRLALRKGEDTESAMRVAADHENQRNIMRDFYHTRATPLWRAAYTGALDMVELLVQHGAHIEARDSPHHCTPLIAATEQNHIEVVRLLLKKGAVINSVDRTGRTSLWIAANQGFIDMVKLLLQSGADIMLKNSNHMTPLMVAGSSGHKEIVQLLLKGKLEIDAKDLWHKTALKTASSSGNVDIVQMLLMNGADIESKDKKFGRSVVWDSLESSQLEVVQLLLNKGAAIEIKNCSREMYFAQEILNGSYSVSKEMVVDILASHGLDMSYVDPYGRSLLMGSHFQLGASLADDMEFINKRDTAGRTAAIWEIISCEDSKQCLDSLLQLVRKGADLNIRDIWENSVLHLASEQNKHFLILDKPVVTDRYNLLSKTQHEKEKDKYDLSDLLRTLLSINECDWLNSKNINGWTPLHMAARRGGFTVAKLLLEAGADLGARDVYDNTPADLLTHRFWHKDESDICDNLRPIAYPTEMRTLLQGTTEDRCERYPQAVELVQYYRINVKTVNMSSILPLLLADGLGMLDWDKSNNIKLWQQLDLLITRLTQGMDHLDPRLQLSLQYAGSIAEGTKVGLLDEIDFQLHIAAFHGCLQVHQHVNDGPIDLSITDPTTAHQWETFLATDNVIMPGQLFYYMFNLLCQVLSDRSIYIGTDLYFCHVEIESMDVFLEWAPTGQMVKLDPAFIVALPDWMPPNSKHHDSPLLTGLHPPQGCHALLHPWGWKQSTFAREQLILRTMPLLPRIAFMTLKICKDVKVTGVKTYDIKNALLQSLHDVTVAGEAKSSPPDKEASTHRLTSDVPNYALFSRDILTEDLLSNVLEYILGLVQNLHKVEVEKKYYFGFGGPHPSSSFYSFYEMMLHFGIVTKRGEFVLDIGEAKKPTIMLRKEENIQSSSTHVLKKRKDLQRGKSSFGGNVSMKETPTEKNLPSKGKQSIKNQLYNIEDRVDILLEHIDIAYKQRLSSVCECFNCQHVLTDKDLPKKQCSKCKFAVYCSKCCQKIHWSQGHKAVCAPCLKMTVHTFIEGLVKFDTD